MGKGGVAASFHRERGALPLPLAGEGRGEGYLRNGTPREERTLTRAFGATSPASERGDNNIYSPFQPQARSFSCICGGAGATTRTGSLFREIGTTISRECRCSFGSPKRGPLP